MLERLGDRNATCLALRKRQPQLWTTLHQLPSFAAEAGNALYDQGLNVKEC